MKSGEGAPLSPDRTQAKGAKGARSAPYNSLRYCTNPERSPMRSYKSLAWLLLS